MVLISSSENTVISVHYDKNLSISDGMRFIDLLRVMVILHH